MIKLTVNYGRRKRKCFIKVKQGWQICDSVYHYIDKHDMNDANLSYMNPQGKIL